MLRPITIWVLPCKDKGDLEAAIDSYKQALKIKPDYQPARTQKLQQQAHICDWASLERDQHLISKLGTLTAVYRPFRSFITGGCSGTSQVAV